MARLAESGALRCALGSSTSHGLDPRCFRRHAIIDLETLAGFQLRRASAIVMSELAERLSGLGLRLTEASILIVLGSTPRLNQSEIARRLFIQNANIVPLVGALVARDLVERHRGTGRSQPLQLTPKGLSLAEQASQEMIEHERTFFGQWPVEDRKLLTRLLAGLTRDPATP